MKNKILAALLTGTLIGASMMPYHAFAADYDNSQTTEKKYASGTEFEQDDIVYILHMLLFLLIHLLLLMI